MADAILLESPHFKSTSKPLNTCSVGSQAYVISLTSLPSRYAACTSAPLNTIDLFDKTTLQKIHSLPGHDIACTSMRTVGSLNGITGPTLMSSGKDGSVKVWDERTGSHSIKMTNLGQNRALLCFDVSVDGSMVAAGTDLQGHDAVILYWDPRQPAAPLRSHSSTHSDDITALHFYHGATSPVPSLLLSASSDGLICTSNAEEEDEDEAVIQVGNWGCSVSQTGWKPTSTTTSTTNTSSLESTSKNPRIWAASDMETFSTWSFELDQLQSQDIRTPSVHSGDKTWVTDYLITCHTNSNYESDLGVFVGSNEGDVALLSNMNLSTPSAPWTLHKLWSNGHEGIVRSLLWDEQNHLLVTGGEDSRINVWSGLSVGRSDSTDDLMDVDHVPTPSNTKRRDVDWGDEQAGKRFKR